MTINKVSLLALAFVISSSLFLTVPAANAEESPLTNHYVGYFQGLVQFFEQKFGISHTDATNAVQEYKTQRKASITPRPTMSTAQMEEREKIRLGNLVKNGKITQTQEDALLKELAALRAKYPLLENGTPEQRKTNMEAMQNELKSWASTNNIDLSVIKGGMGMIRERGMGFERGPRGNRQFGPHIRVTPTPTQ